MKMELSQPQDGHLHVLEEIRSLPLMLDEPLYLYYPAMKLGGFEQVSFFSQRLCALVIELLRQNYAQGNTRHNLVLTAPPYYQLPAAANLLARDIQQLLQKQGYDLPLVEPRLSPAQVEIRNQQELKNYYDYSKNTIQQRIAERQRVQQTIDTEVLKPLLAKKDVIVINDINVTGTQQSFMQQRFDQLEVACCHWLYIFNLDKTLARNCPEIEHQINNSQIKDLHSYADILSDQKTRHTARCIARMFNEDDKTFRSLITLLDSNTRTKIYQLAQREGRYHNSLFEEKMHLLGSSIETNNYNLQAS